MKACNCEFRIAALLAVVLAIGVAENSAIAGTFFTEGNLAVLRADASANNTTATILQLDPDTANQPSPVNTVAIPGSGPDALRISGSATSTGYLSHSDDRKLLTFTGHNSSTTNVNANTLNPRGVGTLDVAGTYDLETTYTGTSGNQTRSASSLNNSAWYIGDQGGIYTNGSVAASPTGNLRSVKAFDGSMYVFSASASFSAVSTINAPSGGTLTGLPGIPLGVGANQDFYMVQSIDSDSAYDVLYILSATSNTVGLISKYSLVSGSWAANGTFTTNFGGFGLAARDDGDGAELFVTTGQGALTANRVLKLFDDGAYNETINITSTTTLYTAPTGTILKGVDFAPIPEPGSLVLLGIAVALVGARRRSA